MPRANDSAAPAAIDGTRLGRMIRRNVVSRPAPSEAAASSTSASSSSSTGCTVRTMNGSVTNASARNTDARVFATFTPIGLCGPYNASSTRPATIVGSANGMSMTTSRTALPGNRSRTSTQAMTVPMTTLSRVTSTDCTTVSSTADRVWGLVMVSQKPANPSEKAVVTTRPSGISTSRLNQSTATPRPSPVGPDSDPVPPARRLRAVRAGTVEVVMSRPPAPGNDGSRLLARFLLDLRDDPVVLVEELGVRLRPAAEVAVDGQQLLGRRRERVRRVVGALDLDLDAVVQRAEALLGVVGLGLLAGEVAEELLRLRPGVGGDRTRVLDEQRLRRHDVVEVRTALTGQDGLVLVGQQHVPLAALERRGGVPAAAGKGGDVAEELGQVGLCVARGAAVGQHVAVGREDVPLRGAGGRRVGGDDLDARLDQVVPALDVLRVALADHDHHDGLGEDALGRGRLPVAGRSEERR